MRAERKLLHGRLWKHWAAAWHRLSKEKYMKGSTVIFRNSLGFKSDIPFWRMLCKNRFNHHIISECLKKIKRNRSQDKKLLKIRKHRDYWKGYVGAEAPWQVQEQLPHTGKEQQEVLLGWVLHGLVPSAGSSSSSHGRADLFHASSNLFPSQFQQRLRVSRKVTKKH